MKQQIIDNSNLELLDDIKTLLKYLGEDDEHFIKVNNSFLYADNTYRIYALIHNDETGSEEVVYKDNLTLPIFKKIIKILKSNDEWEKVINKD